MADDETLQRYLQRRMDLNKHKTLSLARGTVQNMIGQLELLDLTKASRAQLDDELVAARRVHDALRQERDDKHQALEDKHRELLAAVRELTTVRQERDAAIARAAGAETTLGIKRAQCDNFLDSRDAARRELEAMTSLRDDAATDLAIKRDALDKVVQERDAARRDACVARDTARRELEASVRELDMVRQERDNALQVLERTDVELGRARADVDNAIQRDAARDGRIQELEAARDGLSVALDASIETVCELREKVRRLTADREATGADAFELLDTTRQERDATRAGLEAMRAERDAALAHIDRWREQGVLRMAPEFIPVTQERTFPFTASYETGPLPSPVGELSEDEALAYVDRWRVNSPKIAALWAPVPMVLNCPGCGARHIDAGDWAERAHHTHACQECGLVWRPAVVATVGVRFLPGYKNA